MLLVFVEDKVRGSIHCFCMCGVDASPPGLHWSGLAIQSAGITTHITKGIDMDNHGMAGAETRANIAL